VPAGAGGARRDHHRRTRPTRANVIGAYATASRPRVTHPPRLRDRTRASPRAPAPAALRAALPRTGYQGQWVQVSRLGIPPRQRGAHPARPRRTSGTRGAGHRGRDDLRPVHPRRRRSRPTRQVLYGAAGRARARGLRGPGAPGRHRLGDANDMLALVVGAPPHHPGRARGRASRAADLLRLNVRTAPSAAPDDRRPSHARARARSASRPRPAATLNGFPNGRRLFDDVVDIEERYVLNTSRRPSTRSPSATASTATTSGSPTPSRTCRIGRRARQRDLPLRADPPPRRARPPRDTPRTRRSPAVTVRAAVRTSLRVVR
jgi:hypothetical protein